MREGNIYGVKLLLGNNMLYGGRYKFCNYKNLDSNFDFILCEREKYLMIFYVVLDIIVGI